MRTLPSLCLAACFAMIPACATADPASSEAMSRVEQRAGLTVDIASKLWDWAEVGYQETKSSGLLQDMLAAEGFEIEAGVAGIPTAFVAEYGSVAPVIAVLAEFDALPGINQSQAPTRDTVPGKHAGQACGHNLST